jgi:hypothetical protein
VQSAANLQQIPFQVVAPRAAAIRTAFEAYNTNMAILGYRKYRRRPLADGEVTPTRHPLDTDGDDREIGEFHCAILRISRAE